MPEQDKGPGGQCALGFAQRGRPRVALRMFLHQGPGYKAGRQGATHRGLSQPGTLRGPNP
eukprot:9586166-Lingulodinium_polyedra.AAC.1